MYVFVNSMYDMSEKGKEREREEEEEEKEISELFLEIMEGYSDSAIPPLSELEFSPTLTPAIDEKGNSNSRKRSTQKSIDHMENIHKERARRRNITEMFSLLQSIVPNLLHKAKRETIVASTIEYIRRLEQEREGLEKLKKLLSPASSSSSKKPTLFHCTNRNFSVDVAISDGMVFFEIKSLVRRYCLVTEIVGVFARHRAEVLAVNVAVNEEHLKLTVTTLVSGGDGVHTAEQIKRGILLL